MTQTDADRLYEVLRPMRSDQIADVLAEYRARGLSSPPIPIPADALAELQSGSAYTTADSTSWLTGLAAPVLDGLRALGASEQQLSVLRIGDVDDTTITAEMRPMRDGSALVLVSDGIFSMINNLSLVATEQIDWAMSAGNPFRQFMRTMQINAGTAPYDAELPAAYLRYRMVNQRLFGISATVFYGEPLTERPVAFTTAITAMHFTIGHEAAHHVLGHGASSRFIGPAGGAPVCTDGQQLELDADLHAYRAAVHAQKAFEQPFDPGWYTNALMGGLVSMSAVDASERACFIRRGYSHPTADSRYERLIEQLGSLGVPVRDSYTTFRTVLARATAFGPNVDRPNLEILIDNPRIRTSASADEVGTIKRLDDLLCTTADHLASYLERLTPHSTTQSAATRLMAGTHWARRGEPRRALAEWGVAAQDIDGICDPSTTLMFHSLLEPVLQALEDIGPMAMFAATAASAIIEPQLRRNA